MESFGMKQGTLRSCSSVRLEAVCERPTQGNCNVLRKTVEK